MLILIIIGPFLFNIKELLHIGHYEVEKSKRVDHTDGYSLIRQKLSIDYQNNKYHFYKIEFSLNSYGNVEDIGFSHINYLIYVNDNIKEVHKKNFGEPSIYYSSGYLIYLEKDDEFICIANLTFLFFIDSNIYNETIDFQIRLTIPYGPTHIAEIDFGLVLLNIFYVISYILIPVLLYIIIKPDLRIIYNEESRKQDARYWRYLEDRLKKQREEEKE